MPQASKFHTDRMKEYFGPDNWMEEGPCRFLEDQGYRVTKRWTWVNPRVKSVDDVTEKERDCIIFMMDEWDYDGLEFLD